MKYKVEIKYTNPAHEHVSLRRRVDTVTRLVEASSEQEALNRATRQQRSLGFAIKEAAVVNQPQVIKEEVEQIEEGAKEWKQAFKKVASKNLNKDVAAVRSSAYRLDKATKSDDEEDEEVKDKVRKGMSEEAEQVTEAEREAGYKMSPAVRAAQKKSDELSKVKKPAQAGTLAAAKMRESADSDVKMKARKAADKMVNKAKKNKTVNLEPSIEAGKPDA